MNDKQKLIQEILDELRKDEELTMLGETYVLPLFKAIDLTISKCRNEISEIILKNVSLPIGFLSPDEPLIDNLDKVFKFVKAEERQKIFNKIENIDATTWDDFWDKFEKLKEMMK